MFSVELRGPGQSLLKNIQSGKFPWVACILQTLLRKHHNSPFDLRFGVRAPASISFPHASEKTFARARGMNIAIVMDVDCDSPLVSGAREKHLARAREKPVARFRTVLGLQQGIRFIAKSPAAGFFAEKKSCHGSW
jgi:hypothetical protein